MLIILYKPWPLYNLIVIRKGDYIQPPRNIWDMTIDEGTYDPLKKMGNCRLSGVFTEKIEYVMIYWVDNICFNIFSYLIFLSIFHKTFFSIFLKFFHFYTFFWIPSLLTGSYSFGFQSILSAATAKNQLFSS